MVEGNDMDQQSQPKCDSHYQIKVAGHLDLAWADWFDGLTLRHEPDGSTTLTGNVVDQAVLHGLLIKIRDLGLSLLAVQRIGPSG